MARMKTIKVSDEEYMFIQQAREELRRRGYGRLEDRIDRGDRVNIGQVLAGLALGAIAAAGAIAIIELLSGNGEE